MRLIDPDIQAYVDTAVPFCVRLPRGGRERPIRVARTLLTRAAADPTAVARVRSTRYHLHGMPEDIETLMTRVRPPADGLDRERIAAEISGVLFGRGPSTVEIGRFLVEARVGSLESSTDRPTYSPPCGDCGWWLMPAAMRPRHARCRANSSAWRNARVTQR